MNPKRTLIAIYSNATEALIEHKKAERLVLIASKGMETEARAFAELHGSKYPNGLVFDDRDESPHDPGPWYAIILDYIRREREGGFEVIVDITAGTKPMTLGAYAAAEVSSAETSYLASEYDRQAKRTDVLGLVHLLSVRESLGLDWLSAGDKAFELGRFDAASELYARAGEANAEGASVLVQLARARQAWLDGHYLVAKSLWPKDELGSEPQPWNLLIGRLAGKHAYELDSESFATWALDRRKALYLRYEKGHAAQGIAREAWQLIETILRATLHDWISQGAKLISREDGKQGDANVDGRTRLTLGPLIGLICDARNRDWELRGVDESTRAPFGEAAKKLRGMSIEEAGSFKYSGLEVRNGLAHGYAKLKDVESWLDDALARRGALEKLIDAALPSGSRARAPSPLEDPAVLRRNP